MTKSALAIAAFAVTAFASAATADQKWFKTVPTNGNMVKSTGAMPHDGYEGRHWTHPLGCEYSRAGRPGEVVWYVIANTRRDGCPTYIVQRGFSDVY